MSVDTHIPNPVIQTALYARMSHRKSFDGNDEDVVRLPEAALEKLVRCLAAMAGGGRICQIVPFSPRRRVMDEYSHMVVAGAKVQRLYLVPAGDARSRELMRRIDDDLERSVDVRSFVVGASSPSPPAEPADEPLANVPMRDVWLVDDQVVIRQEFGVEGPPVWVVSARRKDVDETLDLWQRLWTDDGSRMLDRESLKLSDPLLESADLIHSAAQLSCTSDHVDRVSCVWYHGVWQYLRLFNMVSSPRWHTEFYLRWLRERMARGGARRVLISGTADYATLAFVLAAAREQKIDDLEVHVIDKCPTPLFACRWYARRLGAKVTLHQKDVLDEHSLDLKFDLIVTDAFLTRFAPGESGDVVHRWADMLNPGGTVITTVRLHPRNGVRRGVAHDVSSFLLRLRERAENWRWMLQIDLKELLDAGREYALKMTSRDLGNEEEVMTMFSANGFDVRHWETQEVEGELCPTAYVRIVATR